MDLVSHRRIDHRHYRHLDATVASARGSFGIYFRVARRLLRRLGIDCGRIDCRLLDRAQETPRARRPLSERRYLYLQRRLELARDRRDAYRLYPRLDRSRLSATRTPLRLRLVCRIRRSRNCTSAADEDINRLNFY